MGAPPLTHAPHIFVADLGAPELDLADRHHLEVLRIAPGAPLVLCDGAGRWREATYAAPLAIAGPITVDPAPEPTLCVAFALTKSGKPELVVQKLTELGVDRIVIFLAERSVARWDSARAPRQLERLERVAREAAMQSRRTRLPEIEGVLSFAELVRRERVIAADRGGAPLTRGAAGPATIAIGPEGGFSPAELAACAGQVCFSPRVLRAETAAIAVAAILAHQRA